MSGIMRCAERAHVLTINTIYFVVNNGILTLYPTITIYVQCLNYLHSNDTLNCLQLNFTVCYDLNLKTIEKGIVKELPVMTPL